MSRWARSKASWRVIAADCLRLLKFVLGLSKESLAQVAIAQAMDEELSGTDSFEEAGIPGREWIERAVTLGALAYRAAESLGLLAQRRAGLDAAHRLKISLGGSLRDLSTPKRIGR